MYRPAHFKEDNTDVLDAFVTAHPLGALVAATGAGLVGNHMPMMLTRTAAGPRLHGHIARANDLWRTVPSGAHVLVMFGGADHYITPSWYPTKQATGQVVPTWNYSVVHAHGAIRFFEDRDELHALVDVLTNRHESQRDQPWTVSDAPAPYIEGMLRAIVGFEIVVDRLEGKFKASQNRDAADRAGVGSGLAADGVSDAARNELIRSR
jgi:transcriptional regulator